MRKFNRGGFGVLIFVALLSLSLVLVAKSVLADSWQLGPVNVGSGSSAVGQTINLQSTFKAPSSAGATYLLDTEVYNSSGARVGQWFENVAIGSDQTVVRNYAWTTTGLPSGNYTFQQGVFTPNWASSLAWNSNAGSVTLGSASWKSSVSLQTSPAAVNVGNALVGVYTVAQSGSYILDTELYNSSGARVQQWFTTNNVNANVPAVLTWNWSPAAVGSYTVKQGIFNANWQNIYWDDAAMSFDVSSGGNPTPTPQPASSGYLRGVNLAGAEFASNKLPGAYNSDYTYPTNAELDYYKGKGLTLIRLPFLWERLQPTLYGSLNSVELGRIDSVVAAANSRGMQVILDPHNYDRYTLNGTAYLIGSSQVPNAAFTDFWSKLAAHYNGVRGIYGYSLMNEPHDTNGTWKTTAQAGLNGIRQSDTSRLVLVPGDSWSGAWTWTQVNNDLLLADPSHNLMYEAHQYFDKNGSGTYANSYDADGTYPNIGVDRVQPFLNWLKANNVRGIMTEYGVPNSDPRWLTVLNNFMTALDNAGVGGTYWAGGPWWSSYALSSEPVNGQDAPVMSVLTKHLGH